MSRVASVWLPAWPIERLARAEPGSVPAEKPFALVEKGPHGLVISAANTCALARGVRPCSALADTRAVHADLLVRAAEAALDRRALKALAHWLGRYGPRRNLEGNDGAWIDVTGVPHLFGGEAALARDLVRRLAGLGISVRLGLADTPGAAWALARFAASPERLWVIAPPGDQEQALAPLPVTGLRLAPGTVRSLGRLGLRRIGDLVGLPRMALAARFRDEARTRAQAAGDMAAAVLMRLDQAIGHLAEPRRALEEPPEAAVRAAFAEPLISSEGIEQVLGQLAGALAHGLENTGRGARRFRLALYRVDGTVAEITVGTSALTRDSTHVCRLIREKLGGMDAGFGIDLAELMAGGLEGLGGTQATLGPGAGTSDMQAGPDPAVLVDRLSNRLGAHRVLRLVSQGAGSHIPERAAASVPAIAYSRHHHDPAVQASPASRAPRPPLILMPPEPVSVVAEVPEGAPQRLVWRRVLRRIARAEGPERIAPEWWRHIDGDMRTGGPEATRDYYRLEDAAGGGYWVFREGLYDREEREEAPRWFMHGLFP